MARLLTWMANLAHDHRMSLGGGGVVYVNKRPTSENKVRRLLFHAVRFGFGQGSILTYVSSSFHHLGDIFINTKRQGDV